MAEGGILRGDAPPHVPAAARLQLRRVGRGRLLRTEGGILHAAAGGNEEQVVLRQFDSPLSIGRAENNLPRDLPAAADVETHVHDLRIVMELRAGFFQIGDHRQNHGFILVVAREAQGAEVGQAADMMDIAADIELHLQRTVPVFKGEHRAPVEPEVGVQDLVAEKVGDGAVVELLVGGKEQAHDLHGPFVGEAELAVGVRVLAPILRGSHQREIGVALV